MVERARIVGNGSRGAVRNEGAIFTSWGLHRSPTCISVPALFGSGFPLASAFLPCSDRDSRSRSHQHSRLAKIRIPARISFPALLRSGFPLASAFLPCSDWDSPSYQHSCLAKIEIPACISFPALLRSGFPLASAFLPYSNRDSRSRSRLHQYCHPFLSSSPLGL